MMKASRPLKGAPSNLAVWVFALAGIFIFSALAYDEASDNAPRAFEMIAEIKLEKAIGSVQPETRMVCRSSLDESGGSQENLPRPKSLSAFAGKCGASSALERLPDRVFMPIILRASSRHQVHPALISAIIKAESRYDARAVSKCGAKGLMQLMPRTAEALGVRDIFNPEHNINAGVRYFKQLLIEFDGDVRLALAAYNAGSKRVRRFQGIPPFKTTRIYVQKVLEYYQEYKEEMGG